MPNSGDRAAKTKKARRPCQAGPARFQARLPDLISGLKLASASPVALAQTPATADLHPLMRHPVIARTRGLPVSADPDVTAADPVPVAAQPYVAGHRRCAIHLDLWRRGCHRDGAADIHGRLRDSD